MSYNPPSIGAAGLTIPSYQDIIEDIETSLRGIYGQDVYLGNDSADHQLMSIISLKCADVMRAIQLSYNNRSPATAIGAALDTLVKLNGIARKTASFSTAQVTLTGTPGALINNGVVQDTNGNKWDLPAQVVLGGGGTIIVSATCETLGAIQAAAGAISIVVNPQAGWTSVTNANAATAGQPVEPDSNLRARQALSVALPSRTMLAGTVAAIAAVLGVSRYLVLENPTGATDGYGNPPHSITAVVEGGTDGDVAQVIYNNRGIGCYTNGTTSVTVTDPINGGLQMIIRFYRPSSQTIYVDLTVHQLVGYTSATGVAIKQAIADYLNGLQIGELVTVSGLYAAAMTVNPDIRSPLFSVRSVKVGTAPAPANSNDITLTFNQTAEGDIANVGIALV